jgi:hypothetical protein
MGLFFKERFMLAFLYLIIFYFVTHGLMLINIIDDGVFIINRVFIGFYQWIYLLPLMIYLKKKGISFRGYLIGGLVISSINIVLIIWILLDPSKFI